MMKLMEKTKRNKIFNRKVYIGNNDVLYQRILNSKLNKYIEYITPEYSIYNKGIELRFDLYIILNVDNIYIEVCIETDEIYHRNAFYQNDMIKDNVLIDANISFIRLDIDKEIKDKEINYILFCIEYIIKTKSPLYYFSDDYIENMNQYFINNKSNDNFEIIFGSNFNEEYMLNKLKNIDDFNKIKLDTYVKNINITTLINKYNKLKTKQ